MLGMLYIIRHKIRVQGKGSGSIISWEPAVSGGVDRFGG